jgi:hypothetical protein
VIIEFQPLPVYLFSLGCHEVSSLLYHVLPAWWSVLLKAQSNNTKQPWIKTSENMIQSKPFFLIRCLYQVFCHCDGKLTNTLSPKQTKKSTTWKRRQDLGS